MKFIIITYLVAAIAAYNSSIYRRDDAKSPAQPGMEAAIKITNADPSKDEKTTANPSITGTNLQVGANFPVHGTPDQMMAMRQMMVAAANGAQVPAGFNADQIDAIRKAMAFAAEGTQEQAQKSVPEAAATAPFKNPQESPKEVAPAINGQPQKQPQQAGSGEAQLNDIRQIMATVAQNGQGLVQKVVPNEAQLNAMRQEMTTAAQNSQGPAQGQTPQVFGGENSKDNRYIYGQFPYGTYNPYNPYRPYPYNLYNPYGPYNPYNPYFSAYGPFNSYV